MSNQSTMQGSIFLSLAFAAAVVASPGCRSGASSQGHEHGHDTMAAEVVKGPHGGRLLTAGDLGIEITIFERGVPPEFRVYSFQHGEPVDPQEVTLSIDLHRFGGRVDRFRFEPRGDYLVGDGVVEEPHSFEVEVLANHQGEAHQWRYESYEGRTEISPAAISASGISIETVGPATIYSYARAHGGIVPNQDRLARFTPRYPGIVKEARKRLGDWVVAGDVLAVIEGNESLQPYEIKSSIAGTVIGKDVFPGEFKSGDQVIYTVADLSTVWADLNVSGEDFRRLAVGQKATVKAGDGIAEAEGQIVYLSPVGAESTQTLLARVELPNPSGEWRLGLFVTGEILVEESNVPVSVKAAGLQTFRDWDVVFLNDGSVFQVAPLELGRRDAEWVEVLSGVEPGDRYAAEGSFVVKADVGKSGATHDH